MRWNGLNQYGRKFLTMCVLAFCVGLLAYSQEQPLSESLLADSYLISESQKQQLLSLLQTLSDKCKAAQASLTASEQELEALKNQSAITEANYKASLEKLQTLQQAWDSLRLELTALQQDKATLISDLQTLQATLQVLQDKYQSLVAESTQLQADYTALQANYKAQTDSFNQLQTSFSDYQAQVHKVESKSLVFEILSAVLAAGWALDAIGVY